jgi:tryptophanyl-tRNA synthetase
MTDETTIPARRRVLSGMRPTGRLHLGNYMGALKNWVQLQHETLADGSPKYECFFFIADFHALTTDYADTSRIPENTIEVALDFLSAGLDPLTIFVQSHVPQHAELSLLLSMFTPLSWLERVPSYKDQQEQLREKDLATYGFLGYPLLQAADILIYKPHYVPVGQDQAAHVELTREVARRFNLFYGNKPATIARKVAEAASDKDKLAAMENEPRIYEGILPEPQVLLTPSPKLPGIDGRKMSKSYGNTILLIDQPSVVRSKMESMSNGGQRFLQSDPGDPDICPVGEMHKLFSPSDLAAYTQDGCRSASIGCLECKQLAGKSISGMLKPIQTRRLGLENDLVGVVEVLRDGAKRASEQAEQTMVEVRERMGLSRSLSLTRFEHTIARSFRSIGKPPMHNLKAMEGWLDLDENVRAENLRAYWLRKVIPQDVVLKRNSDRVFVTPSGKRVYVTTSTERHGDNLWEFYAKPKSYELMVLLCWDESRLLHDFIIPQKVYVARWSRLKKQNKNVDIHFRVRRDGDDFSFQLDGDDPVNINEFRGNYEDME